LLLLLQFILLVCCGCSFLALLYHELTDFRHVCR
jgi:hypothetical protein